MKILILGGSGVIGGGICDILSKKKFKGEILVPLKKKWNLEN